MQSNDARTVLDTLMTCSGTFAGKPGCELCREQADALLAALEAAERERDEALATLPIQAFLKDERIATAGARARLAEDALRELHDAYQACEGFPGGVGSSQNRNRLEDAVKGARAALVRLDGETAVSE